MMDSLQVTAPTYGHLPSPSQHTGVNHLNTYTYLKHLSCAVCFLITDSTAPQFKIGSMVFKTVFCLQDELQMLSVHLGHAWSRSDPPLHGGPTRFCQTDGCCLLQADPDTDHAFAFVHLLFGMFPEHPIPPAREPLKMVPGSLPDWASYHLAGDWWNNLGKSESTTQMPFSQARASSWW